ncbi:MAG: GFA family protein [Silicimonas sp.]|jgi:hypothetical protein|nr:GFA family protein [Silicimonas sp.]
MPSASENHGGCLCGAIRYRVTTPPMRVSFCHCRFCQKVTGTAYAVEPIFEESAFELLQGTPKSHDHVSEGSGKVITLHFCPDCGSPIRYTFERFAGVTGVMAGSFDDPNWFGWTEESAKHIFLSAARPETMIPTGLPVFVQHATTPDGAPLEPLSLERPTAVRDLNLSG